MNFGRIITNDCITTPPPPDERCNDPAFALANPDKCPIAPQLIIKPGLAMLCELGSVQLRAVFVENGAETDVTSETIFRTSNPNIAVVGAFTGHVTGVGIGTATISGSYGGLTAFTEAIILQPETDCCCDDIKVGMMVLVDQTHSMSQAFNSSYPTKLHYARAAATRWISEVNENKDVVGLIRFTDANSITVSDLEDDKDIVTALVPSILQTKQKTSFYDALSSAIEILDGDATLDRKVIVVISDGFDTDPSYTEDADNPISLTETFKSGGGVVVCLGVRSHSNGYSLLSLLATGGFFLNAYDGIEETALDYLSGLKGYICAGNCTPVGDEYAASGSLDYGQFTNWSVTDGHVDLIGNGFMDLLPGNGLYVDMAGSTAIHKGRLLLKESLAIEADNVYRLSVDVAGNQRVDASPNLLEVKVFGINSDGLENPSVAPSFNVINAGSPITPETYRYAYSYVNTYGETELSPSDTVTVSLSDDGVDISIPANSNATLVRVYRTTGASPESRYYLIAELAAESPVLIDTMRKAEMEIKILNGEIDSSIMPPESNTTGTPITILTQQIAVNDYRDDFRTYSFNFTPVGDADVWISVQQLSTPSGYDATGLLLGRVAFENITLTTILFEDDFDEENLQYVPPKCGIGTTYVPGGTATSETTDVIPEMTSNTEPSGEASANFEGANPAWRAFDRDESTYWAGATGSNGITADGLELTTPGILQYSFDSIKTIVRYRITGRTAYLPSVPKKWTFEGSNDESNWTVLDAQEGIDGTDWTSEPTKEFEISSPQAFLHYRLNITHVEETGWIPESNAQPFIPELQMDEQTTVTGYTYEYGYCCYGEGCLDEPPVAQVPDPNPLIDLESGWNPPKQYTSTRTVCVECDEDTVDTDFENLVPTMTSHTTPSGVASASSEAGSGFAWYAFDHSYGFTDVNGWLSSGVPSEGSPEWLQYQFAAATVIGAYGISGNPGSPGTWIFQGSNDGATWVDLDERSGITWFAFEFKEFTFTNTTAYSYYRLYITAPAGVGSVGLQELELYGAQPLPNTPSCASATATSEISQADADAQANAAARAAAEAALQCQQQWTSTQCYTAKCPATAFGQDVTRCATRKSLVSQGEADDAALAAATADATEDLDCTMSNNTQRIELPDRIGDEPARSIPYPSVQYVEGMVGVIQKVTVTLRNFAHELYSDIEILLVSPSGTGVILMCQCMNGASDAVERTFILDDDAADPIPEVNRPAGAGPHTYQPTTYNIPLSQFPSPAPAPNPGPAYEQQLSAFIGEDPNGSWSLWAVDILGLDVGYLANGWEVTITVV